MKYSDHYILGKYIADSFDIRGSLNRICFIWGNITPDLNKFTYLHGYGHLLDRTVERGEKPSLNQRRKLLIAGHTAEGARCYVNKYSKRLIKKKHWGALEWYRFGKVVHYVADRFTHPHTLGYEDGFFSHVEYEENLHIVFSKIMNNIKHGNNRLRSVVDRHFHGIELDCLYRAYRSEEASQENDCIYIIAAATKYVQHIVERAVRQAA